MKYWDIKPIKKQKIKILDYKDSGDHCLHRNCLGCKNGTCSGVHSISCPCRSCSPWMLAKDDVNVVYQDARGTAIRSYDQIRKNPMNFSFEPMLDSTGSLLEISLMDIRR